MIDQLRSYRFTTGDGSPESMKILFHGRYIRGILHPSEGTSAVILMHGAGGGMHGPASIYPDLGEYFAKQGIETMRINGRYPNSLEMCVQDIIAAMDYLYQRGKERFGLVGWSFGGAVVIQAAAFDKRVAAVVTVATQSYGTREVSLISPRPVLLLHGERDNTLPWESSRYVYDLAQEPKELVLYPNGNHGIDQHREEMEKLIEDWMTRQLHAKAPVGR